MIGWSVDSFKKRAPATNLWSVSAANCYFRNLNCNGCIHQEFCKKSNYAMRFAVRRLILIRGLESMLIDIPDIKHKELDKVGLSRIIIPDE